MYSELRYEKMRISAADIGMSNPLPELRVANDIHANVSTDNSISDEDSKLLSYGKIPNVMPYLQQDGYNRTKIESDIDTVVLENKYLKATFVPQWGGRLWSLFDKLEGKDLLYVNPVFQPANLALRNGWISGGVEWNLCTAGHTPFTISPLYVAETKLDDGTPVLRMYEWERIRRVSYVLDAYLPWDSRFLFVKVRLNNTTDKEAAIYWWSNIAVEEKEDTRVVSPADTAYCFDYTQVLSKRPVPVIDGIDNSYTTRVPRSRDLFFAIEEDRRKWIAALEPV